MTCRRVIALLAAMATVTLALPASDKVVKENDFTASIFMECIKTESLPCFKNKVFSFVDKILTEKEDINIGGGITVAKTSNTEEGAPRSIESSDFDTLLVDRMGRFLRTHTIKVDVKGSDILGAIESAGRSLSEVKESFDESRGKKKKAQKMIGPIMAAIALKAATLLPLALGFIAIIAGKALLIGKVALVISTIIGLKKLLGGQQKHVTYEVVPHPHHSSSHSVSHEDSHGGYSGGSSDFAGYGGGSSSGGHGGGWARSLTPEAAHDLAYSAHKSQSSQQTLRASEQSH
ncbi:hypothetical protein QAD02_020137 [Eretmocerus hayati]|uniref:Uncharacterized protein n=1 Tax=Eretmocerus hayati TaxID=131215 RepID=A0ACC2PRD2_9HYME|nr:hypothetical protein QAD02_020137 [Eretmocerus hayati]